MNENFRDFMFTYGWAIVTVFIAFIVLYSFGIVSFGNKEPCQLEDFVDMEMPEVEQGECFKNVMGNLDLKHDLPLSKYTELRKKWDFDRKYTVPYPPFKSRYMTRAELICEFYPWDKSCKCIEPNPDPYNALDKCEGRIVLANVSLFGEDAKERDICVYCDKAVPLSPEEIYCNENPDNEDKCECEEYRQNIINDKVCHSISISEKIEKYNEFKEFCYQDTIYNITGIMLCIDDYERFETVGLNKGFQVRNDAFLRNFLNSKGIGHYNYCYWEDCSIPYKFMEEYKEKGCETQSVCTKARPKTEEEVIVIFDKNLTDAKCMTNPDGSTSCLSDKKTLIVK